MLRIKASTTNNFMPEVIDISNIRKNTISVKYNGDMYYHATYSLYLLGLGDVMEVLDDMPLRVFSYPGVPNLKVRYLNTVQLDQFIRMAKCRGL